MLSVLAIELMPHGGENGCYVMYNAEHRYAFNLE